MEFYKAIIWTNEFKGRDQETVFRKAIDLVTFLNAEPYNLGLDFIPYGNSPNEVERIKKDPKDKDILDKMSRHFMKPNKDEFGYNFTFISDPSKGDNSISSLEGRLGSTSNIGVDNIILRFATDLLYQDESNQEIIEEIPNLVKFFIEELSPYWIGVELQYPNMQVRSYLNREGTKPDRFHWINYIGSSILSNLNKNKIHDFPWFDVQEIKGGLYLQLTKKPLKLNKENLEILAKANKILE